MTLRWIHIAKGMHIGEVRKISLFLHSENPQISLLLLYMHSLLLTPDYSVAVSFCFPFVSVQLWSFPGWHSLERL